MGNMTSLALGTMRTASFAYDGTTPKLTSVTENGLPRAVQYDAGGNEILVGTTASSYSPRNHLLESEGLGYTYDGRGIRTLTEVTGGQGASLLDGTTILLAEGDLSLSRHPEAAQRPKDLSREDAADRRTPLGKILDRLFPRTSLSLGVEADIVGALSLPPTGSRKVNVYLPELQLLTESEFTTGTPVPAWDYVWFAGQPLAQIEVATGATRWTFIDHLGTPILQTDVTGTVVWRLEHEPYGADISFRTGGGTYQPVRFPGQERGVESDRTYNVFRWYLSEWARYDQADPIGIAGGANLYWYSDASPLNNSDATGLKCSKSCPECPKGKWLIYGGELGAVAQVGSLGYGGSVALFEANCLSSGKKCLLFSLCAKAFGVGLSATFMGNLGIIVNAPCASDLEGESFSFDIKAAKGFAGGVAASVGSNGSGGLVGSGGVGGGASGMFSICEAFAFTCN